VVFAAALTCFLCTPHAQLVGTGFLLNKHHKVSRQEVDEAVRNILLTASLSHTSANQMGHEFGIINASLSSTFKALPKRSQGRLAPQALEYLVRSYFAKEHGWVIHGLGTHFSREASTSHVHDASILQEMAPALVETLLDAHEKEHSFVLDDAVAMVAAMEHLVLGESAKVLERVFALHDVDPESKIGENTLLQLLVGYGFAFEFSMDDERLRKSMAPSMVHRNENHYLIVAMEDLLKNHIFSDKHQSNPFKEPKYSFDAAYAMVADYHKSYGKRQHAECTGIKEELMSRDAEGTGRVPLHLFYAEAQNSLFKFQETKEYLRDIGALDESDFSMPKVLVANYVQGPSNCLVNSGYFSICCINECESLMGLIGSHLQKPAASAEQLLSLVGNLTSATVESPRIWSEMQRRKLQEVADRHGGTVPIFGRLFAQWLHFAFPNECPYPSVGSSAARQDLWQPARTIPMASKEDVQAIEEQAQKSAHQKLNATDEENPDEVFMTMWNDNEVLPIPELRGDGFLLSALRWMMPTAAFISVALLLARQAVRAEQIVCLRASAQKASV